MSRSFASYLPNHLPLPPADSHFFCKSHGVVIHWKHFLVVKEAIQKTCPREDHGFCWELATTPVAKGFVLRKMHPGKTCLGWRICSDDEYFYHAQLQILVGSRWLLECSLIVFFFNKLTTRLHRFSGWIHMISFIHFFFCVYVHCSKVNVLRAEICCKAQVAPASMVGQWHECIYFSSLEEQLFQIDVKSKQIWQRTKNTNPILRLLANDVEKRAWNKHDDDITGSIGDPEVLRPAMV